MKRIGTMLMGAAFGLPVCAQEPAKPKTVLISTIRSSGDTADEPKNDDKKDGEKKADRTTRFAALQKELNEERSNLIKEYSAEKDQAAKEKIKDKFLVGLPKQYAEKYLALATEDPKDLTGFKAIMQAMDLGQGTQIEKTATNMLVANHVENPAIANSILDLVRNDSKDVNSFLKEVLARNPSRDAKGRAAYALVQQLFNAIEAAKTDAEAVKLEGDAIVYLDRIIKDFSDVHQVTIPANIKAEPRLLGKNAEREKKNLANIKNLKPGKLVPEITGLDMDEKSFKLSDYKGKVLMLDFWGHW